MRGSKTCLGRTYLLVHARVLLDVYCFCYGPVLVSGCLGLDTDVEQLEEDVMAQVKCMFHHSRRLQLD